MKSIRRVIFVLIVVAFAAGLYVYRLSPSEKWLLLWRSEAQSYAEAMLRQQPVAKESREEFIDFLIALDQGNQTVLFSSHDDHAISVIYAPSNNLDSLPYDHRRARRISKHWYELPIK